MFWEEATLLVLKGAMNTQPLQNGHLSHFRALFFQSLVNRLWPSHMFNGAYRRSLSSCNYIR